MKINGEKAHEYKERLRREADERNASRKLRSDNDQLSRLRQRQGNSLKETARLAWRLEGPVIEVAVEMPPITESEVFENEPTSKKLSAKAVRALSKKKKSE